MGLPRGAAGAGNQCGDLSLVGGANDTLCSLSSARLLSSHTQLTVTEDESRQPPSPCQTATANPKIGLEA